MHISYPSLVFVVGLISITFVRPNVTVISVCTPAANIPHTPSTMSETDEGQEFKC
jgi:hypothetical protein